MTEVGEENTKKPYFEMGKSYKLQWKLSGFTGATKAEVMFGKYIGKPEPKIIDALGRLDSSETVELPVLQYGIANYVAIARVVVPSGIVKFALVAIPFVGK